MPQDRLESIMTMLRQKGAIDPATSAQRLASMQVQRGSLGANEPVRGSPATGAPLPDRPSPEEGTETGMTAPYTARPVIIDALNESIIGIKVEIHRTTDPEDRKRLEKIANQLRKQIQELGGEPVWADESIEEGLTKLTGHGYVAQQRLQQYGGGLYAASAPSTASPYLLPDLLSIGGVQPGQALSQAQTRAMSAHTDQMKHFRELEAKSMAQKRTAEQPIQIGDYQDTLSQVLKAIGGFSAGAGPSAPPQLRIDDSYINQLLAEYGLKPRSPEEIQAHAQAIVERQRLGREQIVQREIERFERENPSEFARARDRMLAAAKDRAAEDQEEFASRGIFYSSVMSGAVEKRDAETMAMINDIAQESASYVLGLREELRDIAEWAVVEEEVVRRELEAEDTALRERLANIRIQVGMWADQMALDAWYQQESLRMQHQQIALQAAQARLQAASQLGDLYSAAFMLHDPEIKMKALSYGYSPEQISSMSLQQQAALAQGIVNSMSLDMQRQETQLNNRYVLAQILSQEMANEEFRWQLEQARKLDSKTSSSSKRTSSTKPTAAQTAISSGDYYRHPAPFYRTRGIGGR